MKRQTLQASYGGGVVQDVPRHELPVGSVWNMVDLVPNINGEPLQKRGPWSYVYATLGSAVKAVAWAPFSAGSVLCAIAANGHIWSLKNIAGVVTATDMGSPASADVVEVFHGSSKVGTSEVQTVTISRATGGTFTLSWGGYTTAGIAYNASAATIQTALRGLTSIGGSNVTVTQTSSLVHGSLVFVNTVTFAGALANAPQLLVGADGTNLVGSAVQVQVAEMTLGVVQVLGNEVQTVTLTATGGTFALGFGGKKTAPIAWNAAAATVQTALVALSTVGTGNATVAGSAGGPYTVTFQGSFVNLPEPLLTVDTTLLTNTGTGTLPGTQRPVFFNNLLFPGAYSFDGTHNPQDMSRVFPAGSYAVTAYKSRLVTTDGTKLYFSTVLDHTTWDVDSYVGVTHPVTGVAALANMIMVFSAGACERLRGTTPPTSTSAGDFTLEPAFSEGCSDAGSIVVYGNQVIWANETGVFISDGAAISSLTEKGGLKQYWNSLIASVYPSAGVDKVDGTLAAGVYGKYYVISVTPHLGSATTLLCDLQTGRWFFFSNLTVLMFSESQETTNQLFMAVPGSNSVGELSSCFTTAGLSNSGLADANGTAITPSLELPFYRSGSGAMRFRDIFLGVNIDNTAGGTGQLLFDYVTKSDSPASAYTAVADDSGTPIAVGSTTGFEVHRIPLHFSANGLGLRVRQTGGSRKTAFYELEANTRVLEGRF